MLNLSFHSGALRDHLRRYGLLVWMWMAFACVPDHESTEHYLQAYRIPEGLRLQAITTRQLVAAPMDLSFDHQGRLWILDMPDLLPTGMGISREAPAGRILAAQDLDQDGVAEHTTVFLDQLVQVSAFTHVYRGLLFAQPPHLWFVEINDDLTPGKRTLVDSAYVPDTQPSSPDRFQPGGLLLNIDNWIYSTGAPKRYRRVNGEWQIEPTTRRGPGGITRDETGRLIYNGPADQVRGDHVIPNLIFKPGFSSKYVTDRPVVQQPEDMAQVHASLTPAAIPLYYQGRSLPSGDQGSVFVCRPDAHQVRRYELLDLPFSLAGTQERDGQAIITTTDEAFYPVSLKNGPDGALYIVDMGHGDLQRHAPAQDSLPTAGRLLRMTAASDHWSQVDLSQVPLPQLVDSLASDNIWIRDMAQQVLIYSGDHDLTQPLAELLNNTTQEIPRIHALYCLVGLQTLNKQHININNMLHHPRLLAHLLRLMGDFGVKLTNSALGDIIAMQDSTVDYYTAYLLAKNFNGSAITYLTQLLDRYDQSRWIAEPIAVALQGDLEDFRNATNGYSSTLDYIDSVQHITRSWNMLKKPTHK